MRRAHIVAWGLLTMAAVIFVYDAFIILRCGFDVNDVYGITDDWGPIDWPTGMRPDWSFVPAFVYAFALGLAGLVTFALWPEGTSAYHGRILRGTE